MGVLKAFFSYIGIWGFLNVAWAAPFNTTVNIPVYGNTASSLTITYFFDYKCRFCREMDKVVNQFRFHNPEVKIVYRPLPLLGIESKIIAQSALAAQTQGKFQAMHDWLIKEGYRVSQEKIINQAALLGMNPVQFQMDLKNSKIEDIIDDTLSIALRHNIRTVPAIMVNGKIFQEVMGYSEFVRTIQHSILEKIT